MHTRKILRNFLYQINNNPVSKLLYEKQIRKRVKLDLTDILPLSKPINLFSPYTNEIHKPNDWYGHSTILKKFLNLPKDYKFKAVIEHGFYLSDQVAEIELESNLPSFITYSIYRKNVFNKYHKKSFSIGPFIYYASHYLSEEELAAEKKRLGDTVVLFPIHSAVGLKFDYNIEQLCRKVKKFKKNFKTLRVCLYWLDIVHGLHHIYKDFGFECVTAGHILDKNFLPRLKSIFDSASITISNSPSTALGYSVFMGKPHYIINQKPKLYGHKNEARKVSEYLESKNYQEVLSQFTKYQEKITSAQRRIVNKFWGMDQIKSNANLLKIIKEIEKIFLLSKRNV